MRFNFVYLKTNFAFFVETIKIWTFFVLQWIQHTSIGNINFILLNHFKTIKYDSRWSAKMCIERHNFICQKPVTLVNGNNNHRRIQAAPTASTMRPHDRTQAFSHDVLSYSHNNGRINREKRKGKEIGENIDLGLKSDRKIKRTKKTRKNTKAPITANNTTQAIKIEETRPTKSSQVVHKNVAETSISTPVPKVLSSSKVASKNYTPEEKRNRLKAKLANLSPEERAEFFAKKRERDARKRKQNSVQ